jgi:RNase P subunit RPR2
MKKKTTKCRKCGAIAKYPLSALEFTSQDLHDVFFYIEFDCVACGKHNQNLFPYSRWIELRKLKEDKNKNE